MTAFNRDFSERDARIVSNTYTTVLRRPKVPHELFATYWRDVHGPLCSRIPGLGWYVQNHFNREQDAHLWPVIEGVDPFDDYELDGGVEIGFLSTEDQGEFQDKCPILFADEQNMFAATAAYNLPSGSTTLVDRIAEATPNGDDGLDRIHLHIGAQAGAGSAFHDGVSGLANALAAESALLKVRVHLPDVYDNANPAPPAPDVGHHVTQDRTAMAIIELAFASPLDRRTFYASPAFTAAVEGISAYASHVTAFAVSGIYTYVRDKTLTLAGLRGSRPAQLIKEIGAVNQAADDVRHLLLTGELTSA